MKISAIRINGFRGITPIADGSPAVDICLSAPPCGAKNLLLFGPNAFGKSSIADAIEWFFRGQSRGAVYFEGFLPSDNAHLNLGKPGFANEGYVELDVTVDGHSATVRRAFDTGGMVTSESLAGLEPMLDQLRDELIVLDHDQFRRFITDAHADKWSTFSSLIGYEDLENFRAGLSSLSGSALTSRFNTRALSDELARGDSQWRVRLKSLYQEMGASPQSYGTLESLRQLLRSRIEVAAISYNLPPSQTIDPKFWDQLFERSQPSQESRQTELRIEKLDAMLRALWCLPDELVDGVNSLRLLVTNLSAKKKQFDKDVLAEFYNRGLDLIRKGVVDPTKCPFCGSPYDPATLVHRVSEQLDALDLAAIRSDAADLESLWRRIRTAADRQVQDLAQIGMSELREALSRLGSVSEVDQKLRLATFDQGYVFRWMDEWIALQNVVQSARQEVEKEYQWLKSQVPQEASSRTVEQMQRLRTSWSSLDELEAERKRLDMLQHRHDITMDIIEKLRETARQFREELRDFSARVVTHINADIQRYYSELHPFDKVKPYLEVEVSGNTRRVYLRCDYNGFPQKDAASVLSESHRNSLGLAIMLAFRTYKQRLGSPLEFLVLDDVTQSLDTTHRTNLLGLMENPGFAELSDQQIIFLTHDRTLADLIKRPGENDVRPKWVRHDIRNWWLSGIVLEPCTDARTRAQVYLDAGDEVAAAVYARRALEDLYRKVVDKTGVWVRYKSKPWQYSIEDYRQYILHEVEQLHASGRGFIDPQDADFTRLFTAQRILNFTVHDSEFLETPMTLQDVQAALDMVDGLRTMFSCRHCKAWLSTLELSAQGNMPQCGGCRQPVR